MCSAQLHFCFDELPVIATKPFLRLLSGQGQSVSKSSAKVVFQSSGVVPALVQKTAMPVRVDLPNFNRRPSFQLKAPVVALQKPVLRPALRKKRGVSKLRISLASRPLLQRFCQQALVFFLFLLPHLLA